MVSKTKIHTQYYLAQGESAPGVTTILGILSKPALIHWSWQCGMRGEDYRKVRDMYGDVGTITHLLIMHHLKGTEPDLSEYSQADIKTSDNCMLSFYEWEKHHKLEPICIETPLTSDKYGFGGTPDYIGLIDGRLELMDFKTGKGIYGTAFYQVAAYRQLACEIGHQVNHARILRIGRDDDEGFEERLIAKFDDEFQLFLKCLDIYNLLKKMGRSL